MSFGTVSTVKAVLYWEGYMTLYPWFPHLFSSLDAIRCNRCPHNAVQHLWYSRRSA
jgi:hypothetical protein